MKHRTKIIIAIVVLAIICGIGFYRIQQYPFQQMPTAFVQGQPEINQLTYADHDKLLLVSDADGNVTFWDTKSKVQLGKLNNVGRWLKTNKEGTLVLYCDEVVEAQNKKTPFVSRLTFIHFPLTGFDEASLKNSVERWAIPGRIADMLPNISRLVTMNLGHTLSLIDTKTRKVLSRRLFDNAQFLSQIRFSRDGRFVLLPNPKHNSYVLNAANLTTFRELPPLLMVAFSNDNQYIAGTNPDGIFQSWNIKTHQHIVKQMHLANLLLFGARDDNDFVLFGRTGEKMHREDFIGLYDAHGTLLQILDHEIHFPRITNQNWKLIFQGYESSGAYYTNATKTYVDVMNLANERTVHRLNIVTDILGNKRAWNASGLNGITTGAITSDGSQAVVSTADGMLRFYDFNASNFPRYNFYKSNSGGRVIYPDGNELSTDKQHNDLLYNGYTILAGGSVMMGSAESRTQMTNRYELGQDMRRNGHIYSLSNIAYSPQRNKILIFWSRNFEAEKEVEIEGASVGYDILNNLFEIRSVKDNQLIHTLRTPQHLFQRFSSGNPTWSNDGKRIALTNGGGCIFVYDVDSGQQIAYLSGANSQRQLKNWWHDDIPGGMRSLAFSPDDKYIAVSRGDGTIYLYSLKAQMPVAQIGKMNGGVERLQFSADGHLLYGITHYNQVRTWDVPEIKP
jgi:WD40 repeat protein